MLDNLLFANTRISNKKISFTTHLCVGLLSQLLAQQKILCGRDVVVTKWVYQESGLF